MSPECTPQIYHYLKFKNVDAFISQNADNWWDISLLAQELSKCSDNMQAHFSTSLQLSLNPMEAILTKVPNSWAWSVWMLIKIQSESVYYFFYSSHNTIIKKQDLQYGLFRFDSTAILPSHLLTWFIILILIESHLPLMGLLQNPL